MSEEVNPTSGNCWLWLMVHFQFKSDCVISRCSVQQQCRSSRMAGDAVEKLIWPQTPPYTPCTPGDFCCMLLYLYCFLCSMAVCEPNSTFALPFFPKTLIKKMLWDMSVSTHLGRHPGVGTLCSPDISLTLDKLRIELMKHVLWIWSWQILLQSFFITFRKKKILPSFLKWQSCSLGRCFCAGFGCCSWALNPTLGFAICFCGCMGRNQPGKCISNFRTSIWFVALAELFFNWDLFPGWLTADFL